MTSQRKQLSAIPTLTSNMIKTLSITLCILFVVKDCQSTSTDELGKHVVVHRLLAPDNRVVIAFDSLLSKEAILSLGRFVTNNVRWEVRGHESKHCHLELDGGEEGAADCQGSTASNVPWVGKMDPLQFSQTHIFKRLREVVTYATNGTNPTLYPFHVHSEVLQRGDNVAPQAIASSQYSREYAFRIFLIPEWRMDDYGDMSFYIPSLQNRTKGSKYDIALTVRPHPGRVILWDASIPTLYRPPSMGYLNKLLSVSIQLTASKVKFDVACQDWKDWNEQKAIQLHQSFPGFGDSVGKLNLEDHLVRQYTDSEGRKVMIYDDVFDEDHLEALRSYLVAYPSLSNLPYDLEAYEQSDNVGWIKTFDALEFPKSSAWEVLSQVASHATGGRRSWCPYDVSLNVVRSGDHTRVHEDCETWEDEFTMVVYMNPDLGPGDYGETMFYNTQPHDDFSRKLYEGVSTRNYDAFAAVNPKYGRVAIFDGHIPHSARPPSTGYTKPRYSFAVKLTVDRKTAIVKKLREMIEDLDLSEEDLLEEIMEATINKVQIDRSEEWLESKYRGLLREVEEEQGKMTKRIHEML